MLKNCAIIVAVPMFALPSQAIGDNFSFLEDAKPDLHPSAYQYVLPKSSSLGHGMELRQAVNRKLYWRYEYFSYTGSTSRNKKNVVLGWDQTLRSNHLMLDWHPFAGTFRLTGGIAAGEHRVQANAYHDEKYSLDIQSFITDDTLDTMLNSGTYNNLVSLSGLSLSNDQIAILGQYLNTEYASQYDLPTVSTRDLIKANASINFASTMPYVGFGWSNQLSASGRLRYSVDIGLLYHGMPDVELSLSGPIAEAANELAPTEYRAYLKEQEYALKNELREYRVYPVFSAGISYLF